MMQKQSEETTQKLLEKELISEEQFDAIKTHRSLGIFSLHNELLFLLYLSVLLFTTGIGTLVYKNIDTIGHTIILALILILTGVCFYFCFKKSKGFQKEETDFENPIYNYLVLLGTILGCIFVGYLQFQYKAFGLDYSLATIVCALLGFSSAYYFDNKSTLSIGITALATAIGITITPQTLLENEIYSNPTLTYYGLVLGLLLIVWTEYANRINLKKHFDLVFLTFALHLIGVCCISGLLEDYWGVFVFLLCASSYYFYKKSHQIHSVSIFVFMLIYSYIGLNILLFKFFEAVDLSVFGELLMMASPVYLIGSIVAFIWLIKQFNKNTHDSIR
jgi:hypothetical protein